MKLLQVRLNYVDVRYRAETSCVNSQEIFTAFSSLDSHIFIVGLFFVLANIF